MKYPHSGDSDLYRDLLEESPIGYAYHKIILDDDGNPTDSEFLEVNSAFEELTGLEESDIIGKRVTEVFPDISNGNFNWGKELGEIALTGEEKEIERFFESSDSTYKVKAFSPKQEHFVTYIEDITKKIELAEISEEFLQKSLGEIDYQRLVDKALDISGAKYVVFSLFEEGEEKFTTVAISGPDEDFRQASERLGLEIEGKTWDHSAHLVEKIKDQTMTHLDALHHLMEGILPERAVKGLEKVFSLGETVVAKIQKDDLLIGDFTLIMPEGKQLENESLVKIYTEQVGGLIARSRSERKLKETLQEKNLLLENSADQVWYLKDPRTYGRVNKAHADFLGADKTDIEGEDLYETTITAEEAENCIEGNKEVFEKKESIKTEEWVENGEGEKRLLSITKTPKLENGEVEYVICSARDITDRKKAEQALNEERNKLKELHDAVDRFQQCGTEDDLCNLAVQVTQRVLDFDICTFYCVEGDKLVPVAATANTELDELPPHKLEEGLAGESFQEKRSILGEDLAKEERAATDRSELRGYMSVPIGDVGVFQVASKEIEAFDERDLELAEILAGHLNEEVKRIRLEEELRQRAIRDALTGLYNRRYFNETLQKEVKKADRYDKPLAFLMIDVNRFKEINDRYSHQTGDEVLQEVANLLEENVRGADTVVRYGGDEFLIMMPETNGGVTSTVNRLKEELGRWNERTDLLDFPLTLAMGVSHWSPDQERDVEEALDEADRKMYEDKRR